MKNDQIKEITSKAIEQLIAALNEGRSETLTSYLTAMAKFHRYGLRNIMLIAMQKPTATHVAGFHAWHKFGWEHLGTRAKSTRESSTPMAFASQLATASR